MAKTESKKFTEKNNHEPIIKEKILFFCQKHLNDELKTYAINLYETICKEKGINISRGKKEIWAATIIHVIARLNGLFVKSHEFHITADTICDFFGTIKSTIAKKAGMIERECSLQGASAIFETPDRFMVSNSYFDEEVLNDEDKELLDNSEVYQTMKSMMSEFGGGDPNNAEMNDSQLYEMIMALLNKFYQCEDHSSEQTQFFGMIMILIDEFRGDEDTFRKLVMEKASDKDALKLQAFLTMVDQITEEEVNAGEEGEKVIIDFLEELPSLQRKERSKKKRTIQKEKTGEFDSMKILEPAEVEQIISRTQQSSEQEITAILDEFEQEHLGIYQVIYGEPSDAIAMINRDMANLYLDLSFDVVWVFREAFGKPPAIKNEQLWVSKMLSLIDEELKSIADIPMDDKFRKKLQNRFAKSSFESHIQLNLLQYLEQEVVKYASFQNVRIPAITLTNNLLFVLVRLMGELYTLGNQND